MNLPIDDEIARIERDVNSEYKDVDYHFDQMLDDLETLLNEIKYLKGSSNKPQSMTNNMFVQDND